MSGKSYSCEICGGYYKNSKSLRTHMYSYHPQNEVKRRDYGSPINSSNGNYDYSIDAEHLSPVKSTSNDSVFDKKMRDIKMNMIVMGADIDILKSSVKDLKKVMRTTSNDLREKYDDYTSQRGFGITETSSTLEELKSSVESNVKDIRDLQDRMDHAEGNSLKEKSDDGDELAVKDLFDDMNEICSFIAHSDVGKLLADIPKLRNVFKLILRTIKLDKLSDDEIRLLSDISNASKSTAKGMIRSDFCQLMAIFKKINNDLEEVFESLENESNDSDGQDSESAGTNEESNNMDTDFLNHEVVNTESIDGSDSENKGSETATDNYSTAQSHDESDSGLI